MLPRRIVEVSRCRPRRNFVLIRSVCSQIVPRPVCTTGPLRYFESDTTAAALRRPTLTGFAGTSSSINSGIPRKLAEGDVNRFLTHLAVKEHVAASTQNQALSAILFLYEHVLEQPLDRIKGVVRARRPKRLPVVLTVDEVSRVISHLTGDKWLIAMLLYGGGLRLLEALRLRVKDLDLERGEITVREGKGDKDRVTTMPRAVIHPLQEHLQRVQAIHQQDVADGYGIRTVQELLGHNDVRTTMIYAHVLNRGGRGVRSPADGLARRPDER